MHRHLALASIFALSIASPALAADAAGIFKSKCAQCHGEDGKAETKMGKKEKITDFTTEKWQSGVTDQKIAETIAKGKTDTKMKAFEGKLTAEEIAALVKHIRGFKAK
jgi:mono/diheme cytochrome c family protein